MNKWLRRLLTLAVVSVGLWFIFTSLMRADEVPSVEKGRSVVVTDAGHYAETTGVYTIDATDEYIFLNHGETGVISVYGWDGKYRFTIVTTFQHNGIPEIWCCGDLLTLLDKNNHVFVYDGPTLLRDYQIESLEQYGALRDELRAGRNRLVSLSGNDVVDGEGRVILTVSDAVHPLTQTQRVIVLAAFFLVFGTFIAICVKDFKKSRPSP